MLYLNCRSSILFSAYTINLLSSAMPHILAVIKCNFLLQHLTRLSTTVAKTLYHLAYNETKEDMKASEQTVSTVLHSVHLKSQLSINFRK